MSESGIKHPKNDSSQIAVQTAVMGLAGGVVSFFAIFMPWANGSLMSSFVVLGIFFAIIADFLLRKRLRRRLKWQLVLLAGLFTIVTILSFFLARPNEVLAFEEAFGLQPPKSIRNLVVRGHIGDGAVYTLRFDADESAIQQLTSSGKLIPSRPDLMIDSQYLQSILENYRRAGLRMDRGWRVPQSLEQPVQFEWHRRGPKSVAITQLLWDRATGHAWATYGWT